VKNKKFLIAALFVGAHLFASEVTDNEIDKNLLMINLGSVANVEDAKTQVRNFYRSFDIYTGLYQNRYYQYLVNIDPSMQTQALQAAQSSVNDAYFVQKSTFDYGIKLLESSEPVVQNEADLVQSDANASSEVSNTTDTLVQPTVANEILGTDSEIPQGQVKVDLIDAVLQTLSRSYKVKAAREKVVQAKHNLEIAQAEFKPTVDVGYYISGNRREPGEPKGDGTYDRAKHFQEERATLTIDQNLYAGGESSANLQKMQKEYMLAKNSYRGLIESEIAKTIQAYFDIVFRRDALKANEENIAQLQKILEIVNAKFESGALSLGELSSVEASISNAMSQLSRTKSRYNTALEYYKYITGRVFENTYPYEKDIDIRLDEFESLQKRALENNNRLRGFVYQIAAKKDSLDIAKAAFKPKIALQLFAQKTIDEEDFQFDENEYMVRLDLSYNLYNGGRDKAAYMKAYSSIQESAYEKEAEILEIIWNLEKLHTSLSSLQESLKSIKDEVNSSIKMVDSYWEGFRYGEQDLYILLQAQRQLNSAQLQYIDSRQSSITEYFKILEVSGELIEYFGIDIENDKFLDMAQGRYYKKLLAQNTQSKELSLPFEIEENQNEVAAQPEEKSQKQEETTSAIKELLSYEERYLMHEKSDFSVVFEGFNDIYEALAFIDDTKIQKNAFIYKSLQNEKIRFNVAYNTFTSRQEATDASLTIDFTQYENKTVQSVQEVQKAYNAFFETALVQKSSIKPPAVEKKVVQKAFETDAAFKALFLNADENFYTINVTTFQNIKDAANVVENYDIAQQSFVFSYGDNVKLFKLMHGVYETYEQAQNALQSLGLIRENFLPVIEKIGRKQELYKRYNQR
jgi:outer membrane protein TolC